jgi:hypothetical protein
MENADFAAIEMGHHSADELGANLTPAEAQGIRERVLRGIAEIERGQFTEYVGRAGLKQLAEDIKARGRDKLDRENQSIPS